MVSSPRRTLDHIGTLYAYDLGCLGSPCLGNFDGDGDVDGVDLATFIGGGTGVSLAEFSAGFGRTNCP